LSVPNVNTVLGPIAKSKTGIGDPWPVKPANVALLKRFGTDAVMDRSKVNARPDAINCDAALCGPSDVRKSATAVVVSALAVVVVVGVVAERATRAEVSSRGQRRETTSAGRQFSMWAMQVAAAARTKLAGRTGRSDGRNRRAGIVFIVAA
jgi:hypothetical protein